MATPTITSGGAVLNKKANKKSRFFLVGTGFTDPSTAAVKNTTAWTVQSTKYHSSTLLTVTLTSTGRVGIKDDDLGDITVTVTNSGGETSPDYPLTVAFVNEDD
jgi:hypothetical protein